MATDFQQLPVEDLENRPDDTEFAWETDYDGPVDSEGNPDPENRDDQDFSWESTVEEPTSVITKRGANYEVTNTLNAIAFIPGTACSMSEAIAYIRYWSRKGTQQKQPVSGGPQNDVPADSQEILQEEINEKYYNSVDEAFDNPEFGTGSETRIVARVPENTAYQSRPRQPVPTRVSTPASVSQPVAGNVYSANPSGSVATVPSALPTEAVWTFLFNPEELQLSSGPDFNRAETWGVSDPANSGQPLSWRSNKNRKLTFSKVLLHGYSFGKRVDTLERGLQELFTAREGDGSDGPPVLEFVWGKRVFGPCVIQNIQVREKAWDNGLLVNAEVSFDLEQVPEWTINDGFVDVLRPGRQSTVNDPLVPASTAAATPTGEDDDNKNKPGGGGGRPDVTGDPYQCNDAIRLSQVMQKQYDELGVVLRNISIFGGANPLSSAEAEYNKWANRYVSISGGDFYGGLYKPGGNFILSFTDYFKYVVNKLKVTVPNCTRENIESTLSQLKTSLPGNAGYIKGLQFINGCQGRIKQYTDDWLREQGKGNGQCVNLRKSRESKEKQLQESKRCDKYKNNSGCSNSQLMSRITCAGIIYTCVRAGSGWFGNSYVWRQQS